MWKEVNLLSTNFSAKYTPSVTLKMFVKRIRCSSWKSCRTLQKVSKSQDFQRLASFWSHENEQWFQLEMEILVVNCDLLLWHLRQTTSFIKCWLVEFCLTSVSRIFLSILRRPHHCRWRAVCFLWVERGQQLREGSVCACVFFKCGVGEDSFEGLSKKLPLISYNKQGVPRSILTCILYIPTGLKFRRF